MSPDLEEKLKFLILAAFRADKPVRAGDVEIIPKEVLAEIVEQN